MKNGVAEGVASEVNDYRKHVTVDPKRAVASKVWEFHKFFEVLDLRFSKAFPVTVVIR